MWDQEHTWIDQLLLEGWAYPPLKRKTGMKDRCWKRDVSGDNSRLRECLCYGLNCIPHTECWSPNPQYLWMGPYLETRSLPMRKLWLRSLGQILTGYDWHPYEKRKFGHRNKHTHWGNIIWWWRQRSGWSIYKPRDARDCHQAERKEEQIRPQSTQKELTPLILGFQPPKLWDNEFLLF